MQPLLNAPCLSLMPFSIHAKMDGNHAKTSNIINNIQYPWKRMYMQVSGDFVWLHRYALNFFSIYIIITFFIISRKMYHFIVKDRHS